MQVAVADAFPGSDGPYWDTRIDDVTSYVAAGNSSFTTFLNATNDCLGWMVNGLVITDVTP